MAKYRRQLAGLAALALLACAPIRLNAQVGELGGLRVLEEQGRVKGVASMRTGGKLYLAVWYAPLSKQFPPAAPYSLRIFEREAEQYKEVFRFDDKEVDTWEQLLQFDSPRLPGFVLMSKSGSSDRGPAIVVALVNNSFRVVYEGDESEFVDLDADGISEILESVWPDGDGYPKSTSVHVWDGKRYRLLMKVGWNERFSPRVRNSVAKASARLPDN